MTLSEQIETDISGVFLNTDDFAVSVSYSDGSHSVTLNAVVSSTVFESGGGFEITRSEYRDYLIESSTLILNGITTTPGRGDTITENGKIYRVTSPDGEDAFAYEDENRLLLRIHTVLVS